MSLQSWPESTGWGRPQAGRFIALLTLLSDTISFSSSKLEASVWYAWPWRLSCWCLSLFSCCHFLWNGDCNIVKPSVQGFGRPGHPLRQAHAAMGKVRDTQSPVHLLDPSQDPLCEQVRDCHWGRVESSPPSRRRSLLQICWARSCTQRLLWCPGSWLPFKLESKLSPSGFGKAI